MLPMNVFKCSTVHVLEYSTVHVLECSTCVGVQYSTCVGVQYSTCVGDVGVIPRQGRAALVGPIVCGNVTVELLKGGPIGFLTLLLMFLM